MKLYVDQGNSRIKLWLFDAGRPVAAVVCRDGREVGSWLAAQACTIPMARVASVRDAQAQAELAEELAGSCADVAFARVDPSRLPTAYADPARLGVDRWLGVLASAQAGRSMAVIVDAGTAFTVDILQSGRHAGGYILPGLALQRAALASQTAQVRFPEPDWAGTMPGTNTAACVGHGSLLALAALVRTAAETLAVDGRQPPILLTGGDAARFVPLLPAAEHHPGLILEGLAAYFGDTLWLDRDGGGA